MLIEVREQQHQVDRFLNPHDMIKLYAKVDVFFQSHVEATQHAVSLFLGTECSYFSLSQAVTSSQTGPANSDA